ncbi:hypothetical protein [Pseudoxanthomonas sp. 10H]|uniref:hypothetical protein n=1 Tax=Pseudoxanthomonas sp. 10H TaxID=3242729 RepID=UPI003557870E
MNDLVDRTASSAGFGPLAFLSIQHAPPGTTPDAFTNEERARAFRDAASMAAAGGSRRRASCEAAHAIEG